VKVKVELPVVVSGNSVTAKVKIEVPVATCSKRTKTKRKRNFEKSKLVRPTAEESIYATASLSKLHPEVIDKNDDRRKTMLETCGGQSSITDSVISTMLSQNTTDSNAKAAWSNLKKAFPDWNSVVDTDLSLIENAIKVAGLAKTRAERIQNILKTVKYETGEASLDYIRDYSDEQIKRELSRFKGLGPKTISCVLLFALGRDEFPVDTHVLRITQKMGWVSSGTSREQAYDYLNDSIPNKVKMDLHCLLVRHGKVCHRCAANGRPQFPPRDGNKLDCPLINVSTWGGKVPSMQKDIKIKVENHLIPDAVKS
jgi:endonuclease-3